MNVLITSVGRRVSLLKAFKDDAKLINTQIKIFACDLEPELSAACRISDGFFKVPSINDENYVESLIEICIQNNIKIIIPTIDTELVLLSNFRNYFLTKGINIIVSEPELIKVYRNKRLTKKFFKRKNINTSVEYNKKNYTFPMFIKPEDGSRSIDTYIIRHEEEMKPYFFENDKLMFLEFIDHNIYDEFTIDLYYDKNHDLKCLIPRQRLFVREGEVNKAVTRKGEFCNILWNKLKHLNGARGVITLQIFKHKTENTIFGIEVNPRFSGGYPLAYLAGGHFPLWIMKEYLLQEEIQNHHDWQENLLMLRYDAEILIENYE